MNRPRCLWDKERICENPYYFEDMIGRQWCINCCNTRLTIILEKMFDSTKSDRERIK